MKSIFPSVSPHQFHDIPHFDYILAGQTGCCEHEATREQATSSGACVVMTISLPAISYRDSQRKHTHTLKDKPTHTHTPRRVSRSCPERWLLRFHSTPPLSFHGMLGGVDRDHHFGFASSMMCSARWSLRDQSGSLHCVLVD